MSKIGLVEIFRSVQGEGYNAGREAIFVRFAGCNLSCVFADGAVCDTPYQRATEKLELVEIMARVQELAGGIVSRASWPDRKDERPMLILTGGEPTLQPQFDAVAMAGLADGFYVAVETNGTKWRPSFHKIDWICVSPKASIRQGSPQPHHNPHPQSSALDLMVKAWLEVTYDLPKAEYRYVISSRDEPVPDYFPAFRHYVSPAVLSDGTGLEWKTGFPGFVTGALERCLEIAQSDSRWRLSTQQHKQWRVR